MKLEAVGGLEGVGNCETVILGLSRRKKVCGRPGADRGEIGVGCNLPRTTVARKRLFVNWLIVAASH